MNGPAPTPGAAGTKTRGKTRDLSHSWQCGKFDALNSPTCGGSEAPGYQDKPGAVIEGWKAGTVGGTRPRGGGQTWLGPPPKGSPARTDTSSQGTYDENSARADTHPARLDHDSMESGGTATGGHNGPHPPP